MAKKPKPITTATQFINELNSIGCGLGYDCRRVFGDWLQMIFSALHCGKDEEGYLQAIKPYKDRNVELVNRLAHLFGELTKAMEGGNDVLGQIFEEGVTFGAHGQFFTPQPVADMMAKMSGMPEVPKDRPVLVNDPACGSGRQLLAFAKNVTTNCILVGQDIDENCCKMTAINIALNGLNGYVIYGNSLSSGAEMYRKIWRIGLPVVPGIIFPVSYEYFSHRLEMVRSTEGVRKIFELEDESESNEPKEENQNTRILKKPVQPMLFDLAG